MTSAALVVNQDSTETNVVNAVRTQMKINIEADQPTVKAIKCLQHSLSHAD